MENRTYKTPPRYAQVKAADLDARTGKYAREVKMPGSSLFIYGPVGTGKTHTMHAMAKLIVEERNGYARVINFADALREIKADWDRHWTDRRHMDETMREYQGVLMLDDVGAEKPSEWAIEVLYGVINWRYERGLPTVISSNIDLEGIGTAYGDRIASRIVEMCGGTEGIVQLSGKDRRMV